METTYFIEQQHKMTPNIKPHPKGCNVLVEGKKKIAKGKGNLLYI